MHTLRQKIEVLDSQVETIDSRIQAAPNVKIRDLFIKQAELNLNKANALRETELRLLRSKEVAESRLEEHLKMLLETGKIGNYFFICSGKKISEHFAVGQLNDLIGTV